VVDWIQVNLAESDGPYPTNGVFFSTGRDDHAHGFLSVVVGLVLQIVRVGTRIEIGRAWVRVQGFVSIIDLIDSIANRFERTKHEAAEWPALKQKVQISDSFLECSKSSSVP